MRAILPEPFVQQLIKAQPDIQRRFLKQLANLLRDLQHPGLHAKKYDEARNIWQARVNGGWRFYFRIEGDTYVLEYPLSSQINHRGVAFGVVVSDQLALQVASPRNCSAH